MINDKNKRYRCYIWVVDSYSLHPFVQVQTELFRNGFIHQREDN